jgi:arylsulfatase A-like enzyme
MAGPNFVFILADDLGWADLGSYGSSFHETPNLDRLAREGVRFTDAYASCPVCSPTRASIMTGKYPATVGITNYIPGMERGRLLSAPYLHYLPLTEKTIARALSDAGYATWHVGKWHLGGEGYWPSDHGFEVNVAGSGWGSPRNGYFSPWGIPDLEEGPEGEYLTDRLTDEAVRLIERSDGRPFLLNLWYYTVHIPIQGKPDEVEKFRARAASLGLDRADPFEEGERFPCEHKRDKRVVRRRFQSDPAYAAMVGSLDEGVGRVLGALEEKGLSGHTVVFFTSDNGGLSTAEGSPTSNAPLSEGKGWMYEGGTREPLIVKWPALQSGSGGAGRKQPGVTGPGSVCDATVTSPDFYPTILEMAGLDPIPEQHVDGRSFAALLRGDDAPAREAIFWHYPHYGNQGGTPGCSVRSGRHKLIEFFEDRHVELYDLRDDVSEERDLAAAEPELAGRLRAALHAWLGRAGARIPEPNPDYVPPDDAG